MNDAIKISEAAREAARIYFDCHPDSPQWASEVEDLASRFECYADERVKELDTNRRAFIAELESVLTQRDQRIAELEAALKSLIQELARLRHDVEAYRGALGYSIPGNHDGKLSDGQTPQCGLCNSEHRKGLEQRVKELEAGFRHRHVNNGVNDRCDVCGFDLWDEIHERMEAARKQP